MTNKIQIGDTSVELCGKPFVIGVDTFDGTDWLEGYCETDEEAIDHSNSKRGQMLKMYAYNKEGSHIHDAGEF